MTITLSKLRWFFLIWLFGSIVVALFKGKLEVHTVTGWIDTFAFIVILHVAAWVDSKS
jgi:hypothetical protein